MLTLVYHLAPLTIVSCAHAQGLLEFLDCTPYYHQREWDMIINTQGRMKMLQSLLHGIMIRRTHADVGGPPPAPPPHRRVTHAC